jgi:hypothetical protein
MQARARLLAELGKEENRLRARGVEFRQTPKAKLLAAMLDAGRPVRNMEVAQAMGVSAQTASISLLLALREGLIVMEGEGHRTYRIADNYQSVTEHS